VQRPNFVGIRREGPNLVVTGQTPEDLVADAIELRVVLTQGETIAPPASPDSLGLGWQVRVPADGFESGTSVAFGIEIHRENSTTITWAEALDVP